MERLAGRLGVSAVALFTGAFVAFSLTTPGFSQIDNFVSELGAKGQPNALWWNLIGFFSVGVLLAAFGVAYGRALQDRLAGALLTFFGVGFAAAAFPVDMDDPSSPGTILHILAICLGLAGFFFGLARISMLRGQDRTMSVISQGAAFLAIAPVIAHLFGGLPEPATHRLFVGAVFGWVGATSIALLLRGRRRD